MLKPGDLSLLLAALLSFLFSVYLWFLGDDRESAVFVGLWVPSILAFGGFFHLATRR